MSGVFPLGLLSDDEAVRDRYWRLRDVLTPAEAEEFDRLDLQSMVGRDHSARFAELEKIAADRVDKGRD